MKAVKSIVIAGVLALFVGGGVALPVQDAEAATQCRTVYRNGVYQRICTTRPGYRSDYRGGYRSEYRPRYRTVCRTYWRHGERYRSCRRVGGRW